MYQFDAETYTRNESIEGIGPWKWILSDTQSFGFIRDDWVKATSKKIEQWAPKPYHDVVCAGGQQGIYPKMLSRIFKNVYTFEPDPLSFHCLVNNCQEMNVFKTQAALGTERGLVAMNHICLENAGMHQVTSGGSIPMIRIDDFAFHSLSLIQLDIEGHELPALMGAERTITQHAPVIFAEFRAQTGYALRDWLESRFGYKCVDNSNMDKIYVPQTA
jgi:FkbM family methyltransferase